MTSPIVHASKRLQESRETVEILLCLAYRADTIILHTEYASDVGEQFR